MVNDQPNHVYIGSYAQADAPGIYVYTLDPITGHLALIENTAGIENPSFLTVANGEQHLYVVSETGNGQVVAYHISNDQRKLSEQARQATLGCAPCYVSLNARESHLFTVNYVGGNINLFVLDAEGRPGELAHNVQHTGRGLRDDRQEAPHPHSVVIDPGDQYALVSDLGLDCIVLYKIDYQSNKLIEHGREQLKAGAGPRHLVFHPNNVWAYVINELDSTITVFEYSGEQGSLNQLQTISTLPEGYSKDNIGADIHISPDGSFLYASNRGHNSIVVYGIDESGKLEVVEHVSTQGEWPRNFAITPDGMFLLVANQQSNAIIAYIINKESGQLTPTGESIAVPQPVCIKIV